MMTKVKEGRAIVQHWEEDSARHGEGPLRYSSYLRHSHCLWN